MSKHEKMPVQEVLDWLFNNHPELHKAAELDRDWVWLPVDLRGDHNKPTREAIKEFGFRFAKRGHALESGNTGTWSHSCNRPTRFKRKGGGKVGGKQPATSTNSRPDPHNYSDLDEVAALLG